MRNHPTFTKSYYLFVFVSMVIAGVLGAFVPESSAAPKPRGGYDVDEPGRTPYHATVSQLCFIANPACDFIFPAVPAGKRLVVVRATGYFSSGDTATNQFIFASVRKGGQDSTFLPTNFQGPVIGVQSIFVFNQPVQEYYDPGENPVVRIATGNRAYPLVGSIPAGAALPFNNTVTLSGYLIDCVAAACQPVGP